MAIAPEHPGDAIALLQECLAGDPEEAGTYHETQAQVHLMHQQIPQMFAAFDRALGRDGFGMMAHGAMQYAFLVGLYRDETRYRRALGLLKGWDRKAMLALMRRFEKSFGGNAGEAMILFEMGKRKQAIKPARRALEQAMAEHGPIPGHPEMGRVPNLPDAIRNRLIVAADLWDEDVMGPQPPID
ncbi:hypothetical protein [Altererythrobacter sp. Z27]|uniref:hypothetical protein n=1 Tax=Altererythrobacter sp. Z27 TaxID=3461147 RepID=UPI004043E030